MKMNNLFKDYLFIKIIFIFIFIGLTNELTLRYFFSEDNILNKSTIYYIRTFNFLSIFFFILEYFGFINIRKSIFTLFIFFRV